MKRINILDDNTSNKIAAGEVVERPSSVVKELVENSIDANSKNIIVEIENGGETLIKVIDDGDGIHPEDISKAFLPHATSKIKTVEDIYSISTLGFRGEALPSIASVSKTLLKSKPRDVETGNEISITGGNIDYITESGVNYGTTIEVRDIFYNVPARKKFLKSSSREAALINDIITRIAISNPDISFTLTANGKKMLNTYGNGKIEDVIRNIYGKTILDNVTYFQGANDTLTIHGYIGSEEISRGSRNNQSIYINGRYIKNKTITAAVETAFKSFATVNKYPFFIINVETYPEFVDVNIHPTKAEVKFKDERELFKIIFDTVHNKLKENVRSSFMEDEINRDSEEKLENLSFSLEYEKQANAATERASYFKNTYYEEPSVIVEVKIPVDLKNDVAKEEDNGDFKEIIEDVKDEISEPSSSINEDTSKVTYESRVQSTPKIPPLNVIGQFNKTYILCEYADTLYVIDQHAAHEKYLFEKYYKDIKNRHVEIQPLLIPSIIQLTLDDYVYYEDNMEIFKNAGFVIEPFGINTVSVKEVPYFLGKLDPKGLFLSILDNLKNLGTGQTIEVKYNRIATLSCKSAVKANNELTIEEMKSLVNDMREMEDPYHCPHGRPTIIKLTNYELEKRFRRIT
ncbi:DNA mismatch repair endonuclease MutL [Clostridium paridis]|uniref:DNA mismatch repair protein MutL n=1 Tax=Clostridium paridis TaxID=2803863 RepID=A0A937FCZ7_9CLOT|nr:DNA mismatch repair endonuclease MutL [Clostridium paridis]MBL4930919.1 DNA mismatch repair endonuclease MutL [Clostridium paridis]